MKKEISTSVQVAIGAAAILLVVILGFVYFKNTVGPPAEDVDLAKKQAAVEHQQFMNKVGPATGGAPDAGAAEMEARRQHPGH